MITSLHLLPFLANAIAPTILLLSFTVTVANSSDEALIWRPPNEVIAYYGRHDDEVFKLTSDGYSAFVLDVQRAVNLWHLAVYYWPEWFGAATIISTIAGLLIGTRRLQRLRRHRGVSGPFCCKCGYCLTGTQSQRCPECGVDLSEGKMIARASWRQTLIRLLILVLVIPISYSILHVADVPRRSWLNQSVSLYSESLFEWCRTRYFEWGMEHSTALYRVRRKQLNPYRYFETILGPTTYKIPFSHSRDRHFIIATDKRRMIQWDIDQQRVVSDIEVPQDLRDAGWPPTRVECHVLYSSQMDS